MKKLILTYLLCLSCTVLFAQQNYLAKGTVTDTIAGQKLYNASIAILNAKDSTLYKFTRADAEGNFSLSPLRPGKFILLLTYPKYADYVMHFELNEQQAIKDFGSLNLTLKATLLNEVLIKGESIAIKIKGDTTEFNAASYTIQPNDKVEDLLKKMPGIQIDQDGKITAQGKTVPKVLVDGEEFFGDDPTLVTKNLRADMIDKVQLYEKKSDQATFTGVDDGSSTQTINLVLKEDKKKGVFGKMEGGAGSDGFYTGQLLVNKFKAKEKIALFATLGNNGRTGLNWEDNMAFSSESNIQMMDDGLLLISGGEGDDLDSFDGTYYGDGIPTARNAGLHYDTKWNKDKEALNANYKIGSLRVDANRNSINIRNLPSGQINTESNEDKRNNMFRHKLDFSYSIKLDTMSTLKVIAAGSDSHSDTESAFDTFSERGDRSLLNTTTRTLSNAGDAQSFKWSALYTRKLKKAGRNFSLNLEQSAGKDNREGNLYAENAFYDEHGVLDYTEVTDQFKTTLSRNAYFAGNLTYTEPFSKTLSVVFNYGLNFRHSDADRQSYNASAPGRYDILDPQYSNHFISDQLANQGGAILSYKNKKATLNGGLKMNTVNFDQSDVFNAVDYRRQFTNWMPQARYQYKFSQYRSFSISYSGSTPQPSIAQLQPVKVNDDVMNIPIGNPDLKPAYNSGFSANYNSYKVISSTSMYIYGSYSFVNMAIVNNTTTDPETGKSFYQFINLHGKTPSNYSLNASVSRKVKSLDMNVRFGMGTYGNTAYNYINNELNQSTRANYSVSLGLSKYVEKKYDFSISFNPAYSAQESSTSRSINSNSFNYTLRGDFAVYLPAKFSLRSDAYYLYNGKTAAFDNNFSQTIINGTISKAFLKSEALKLNLSVNDLLNQNSGFSRYADANSIIQSNNSTIKRYFMFTLSWDFNKMGGQPTP